MGEDTFSWIIIILIVILGISIMDSLDDEHEQLNKEITELRIKVKVLEGQKK